MPSWNVHTAHAESILADSRFERFGIGDANAYLFGNYVPDIYVGFMVPGVSFHIDYCLTHDAAVEMIPVPFADRFWDRNVAHRRPKSPTGTSLVLGAWAHLVADRFYNGRFRAVRLEHAELDGDELRRRKQGDFDLFGRSLRISREVEVTPELLEAAQRFVPYHIAAEDVYRTIDVASAIVREGGAITAEDDEYRLLTPEWMAEVFDACNERIAIWLIAWQELEAEGHRCLAVDVRERLGLLPATPDDPDWQAGIAGRK